MSVKKYIKERFEKRNTLYEMKKIIMEESKGELKTFMKMNINTFNDVLKLFVNIGNVSYFCGDTDTFEYFVESIFEIINTEHEGIDNDMLIKHIYNYGLMSAHNYDVIPYYIILNNIIKNIKKINNAQTVNNYLKILKDMALISITNSYKPGVLEALHAFGDVYDYFTDENMQMNGFYLKNILISIIHSAEESHLDKLKEIMIFESKGILGLQDQLFRRDAQLIGTGTEIEGVEPSQLQLALESPERDT